jgi:5-oxoprolinase (ATP-hydrolysing)
MPYRIGIDVGGTFTDFLLFYEGTGASVAHKTPSTPSDPSEGVIRGLSELLQKSGVAAAEIAHVMHGTTVSTNAVLEGRGARVGLLTTRGFEQVLHLARGETPGPMAGWVTMIKPDPLAAVEDTRGVAERMSAQGDTVLPLDLEQARAAAGELVQCGVESIAVSLINSYANPAHERRLRDAIAELHPGLPVSISSDVLPEFREYERTNVVVMNAYVRPRLAGYASRVRERLRQMGVLGSISILRSDGGLMTVESAMEQPVHSLFSGPAGGVAGAVQVACAAGHPDFLSLDMGGTSTDVALCVGGEPVLRREAQLGYFPLKVPAIDVRSVGAGGGSVAHVPELTGALRVGPASAGAEPGPAAYGKGGLEPTVTDANLVLGHLPPDLLGGAMKLDPEKARVAVGKVAEALGISVEAAAEAIVDVVNENMVGALRLVSVEKGYDPRDFALVAFGGAGPLHANALAELMGAYPVIVPATPGVLAALGGVVSPFRSEFAETFIRRFDRVTSSEVVERLRRLEKKALDWLAVEGIPEDQRAVRFTVDVRYHKQALEVPIEVDLDDLSRNGFASIAERFADLHERQYAFRLDVVTEFVNLRAVALSTIESKPPRVAVSAGERGPESSTRRIFHRGSWLDASLRERRGLQPGDRVEGPAIITQVDSTTVVLPGHVAEVDPHHNLLITPPAAAGRSRQADSPIVVDIIENALKNVRREMDAVVFRAAMSTVIREEHDSFPLVTDEQGRMVAGQFGWQLDEFFDHYPKERMEPGDVLILNDPYLCGGAIQHTPDMLVLRPLFFKDELVGFASQLGNLMDIGGAVPGSMPTAARSIFEEGIRFPPVKIFERGMLVQPIVDILAHNSRTPELTVADTLAMAAATRVAELRVLELCERFGVATYRATLEKLLERTRRAAALMIERFIPEQPLEFEDYVDDDGRGNGPFKIRMSMWREDGRAVIDFAGSSPQAEGPINLFMGESMFKMNMGIVLIMTLDPQILFNHGYHPLIEVRYPRASIVQPEFPAPLSNRSHTLARVFDVLQGLLAKQNPEMATGAACGSSPHLLYSGTDREGEYFFYFEINYGGIPGRPAGDGMDVHAWWPNFTAIPVEYAESYFPIRVERMSGRMDSGGAGRHRGGNGLDKVYEFLEPGEVSVHDDRHRSRPWGIGGGLAAEGSQKVLLRKDGSRHALAAKFDGLKVEPGDRMLYLTAGGGGWGDPLERNPESVRLDVLRGFLSVEKARVSYGVVVGGDGLTVDFGASDALRRRMRSERPAQLPVFDFGPGRPNGGQPEGVGVREVRADDKGGGKAGL